LRQSAIMNAALAVLTGLLLAGAPAKGQAQTEAQVQLATPEAASMPAPAPMRRQPVIVELYTSQGCASCPPAEEWLGTLAPREDVIALALHVDYWDYLGWEDRFASPDFTARQKRYARHLGEKMIYTPQVIINGGARLEGSYTALLDAHIEAAQTAQIKTDIQLNLSRIGDTLWIEAEANPPLTNPVMVQLVRYLPQAEGLIARGENAGLEARHHNIVTDWRAVAEWSGKDPLRMDAPAQGENPVVVILQEHGPGTVVAAARLR